MKPYFAFQWHITDDCDQRCKHCYIFSENACKALDSMSWPQMQEVVANCCDFCEVHDRQPYFYITGGDPILHPDFWRLLELLWQNRIPFTIMGNPFHLTDEACARMKAYGCEKYQLSIDGMRETHDWFRKPGSFDCTLEKIGYSLGGHDHRFGREYRGGSGYHRRSGGGGRKCVRFRPLLLHQRGKGYRHHADAVPRPAGNLRQKIQSL